MEEITLHADNEALAELFAWNAEERSSVEFRQVKLRRAGAGPKHFKFDGNTEFEFNFISDFLKKKDLEQSGAKSTDINPMSLNSKFFDTFDRLNGKSFTDYEDRIDSFTHSWLRVNELLAIIAYLDNTFLDVIPFEYKDYFNDVYIHKHTYNMLNEEYNDDDQSIRISTARKFLNMNSEELAFSKFMPKFER